MIVKTIEQRVAEKVDAGLTIEQAKAAVDAEGVGAMSYVARQVAESAPKPRAYKIKRSPKGARVKVPGFEGRSFSFGPIWIELVKRGKGRARTDQLKVRAHAAYLGIPNAATAKFEDVLAALQARLISQAN